MKKPELTAVPMSFWRLRIRACAVILFSATVLLHGLLARAASIESMGTQYVYFGTYTGAKSKGIYRSEFDPATGKLSSPELAAETRNPTFLALDPQHRFLYAVNEVNDFGDDKSGAVSAFRVDAQSGRLTFLNQQASGGAGPCHLAIGPKDECMAVANYGSGSVAALPIERDGRLGEPSCSIQHQGSSVNPQRQEGPHAHFATWDPTGRLVLACDLGLDKVMLYHLDAARRVLSPADPPFFAVKPGSGPRHLAFGPDGHYAYLLNEMGCTLTVCAYDPARETLNEIQSVPTLPAGFNQPNTCAEVQVHPNGRFVYASNRGHDSIAVFAIEPTTGKVKLVQHESTHGRTPRHFTLDPTAHWLLAENQDSDNVVVLAVDTQTGRLSGTGTSQKVGAPVCAVFVPKQ